MKVTATKSIRFPKFDWGINAGATRDLPTKKEAQETILAHPAISKATTSKSEQSETKNS